VGDWERAGSTGLGAILAVYGLKRRSLFGLLLSGVGASLVYRGVSGHCDAYEALGVNTNRPNAYAGGVRAQQGLRAECSETIRRPADRLFRFWRQLENLPRFMAHLESVAPLDERRSHWVARGPAGARLEWDAAIINEEENRLIAWQSEPGSGVSTAGSVRFEPAAGHRGTVVRVSLKYDPPGGKAAARLADLFGVGLEHRLKEDMRRFKQLMEAGEIATVAGQASGPRSPLIRAIT
jgi:uncharacterized membrane protein